MMNFQKKRSLETINHLITSLKKVVEELIALHDKIDQLNKKNNEKVMFAEEEIDMEDETKNEDEDKEEEEDEDLIENDAE